MDILPEPLRRYAEEHTTQESPLLHKINRDTHLHELKPRMLSGHLQGRVLSMLSYMIAPQYILEIGTYTGYSALCLAEGLKPEGKLVTLDVNEELKPKVEKYFEESGFRSRIEFIIGKAHEIIPTLSYTWDLVFIDADKANYPVYFDQTIGQVRPGGFIIVDNVLWSGKVADDTQQDKATLSMRKFNQKVHEDPRVENVLLPIRDGLTILRKI